MDKDRQKDEQIDITSLSLCLQGERKTDTQMDRQAYRETDKQKDRQAERQTSRETDVHRGHV